MGWCDSSVPDYPVLFHAKAQSLKQKAQRKYLCAFAFFASLRETMDSAD
jgi:hypothetical protein